MAELNAPEALDVVFDFLGGVVGFQSHFASRLLLDQAFVADDGLVGDGSAHVVDGAAAGHAFLGGLLVGQDGAGDGSGSDVQKQGHIDLAEDSALLVSLAEQTHDFGGAHREPVIRSNSILDIFMGDQIQEYGNQARLLDAFAAAGRVVDGDGQPQNLADFDPA